MYPRKFLHSVPQLFGVRRPRAASLWRYTASTGCQHKIPLLRFAFTKRRQVAALQKANMNRRTLLVFIFLLTLSLMNLPSNAQKSVVPDLIITNAVIHTMDPAQPIAEAVAIYGNHIVAVGSSKDIKKMAASNTRVIDAKKRLV